MVELDISSETGYTDGALILPEDFACEIRPRSEKRKETIMKEFAEADRDIFPRFEGLGVKKPLLKRREMT